MGLKTEAWDILTKDEQMSISLTYVHNKSSWEAGEVMNKAHYKYLEINSRAERFLRMFTDYYETYGELLPWDSPLSKHFREYLTLLILERRSVKDAVEIIGDKHYKRANAREMVIMEEMAKLKTSKKESERALFDLLLEFDRWNNFRILPKKIQQPSAFKRRTKGKELKHLKSLIDFPLFSISKIKERYATTGHKKGYYFVLFSQELPLGYEMIKIKDNKKDIRELSQLGIFLFQDRTQAMELSHLVISYFYPKSRLEGSAVIKGLNFWTPYRKLIAKAINYQQAYNLIPNRRYMEDALVELQLKKKRIFREK